jgi:hypothetical protein
MGGTALHLRAGKRHAGEDIRGTGEVPSDRVLESFLSTPDAPNTGCVAGLRPLAFR